MCIIAAKPANTPMPSQETIRAMWMNNPDGAGIMYPVTQVHKARGKKTTTNVVQIEKGFMHLADLTKRLEELSKSIDLTATPMVLHFRITTHGGTCPENCHPFPVTSSIGVLQKRKSTAKLGVAHNGIIHSVTPRKGISDTMEYIATQLDPLTSAMPRWYENKHALRMVENAIDSKLAVLTPEGSIHLVGRFEESDGIMYSNSTYIPYRWSAYRSYGSAWDAYDEQEVANPSARYLMYLDEVPGSYVRGDGAIYDGVDYAIDSKNSVYYYDGELGYWVEDPALSAVTAEGTTLKYNYKKAVPEQTLTEGQAEVWYDYLYNDYEDDTGENAPFTLVSPT